MNDARPSDGLLSARQTMALLAVIARHRDGCSHEKVLAELSAISSSSRSRGFNSVEMLGKLGILLIREGAIRLHDKISENADEWFDLIASSIAKTSAAQIGVSSAECLQVRGTNGLWLDSMLLPSAAEGIPLWIVEFSVATRESLRDRFWKILPQYEALFLDGARTANSRTRRKVSLEDLERRLAAQAATGYAAEIWTLEYERRRLASHPLVDQIKLLSQENVGAGYDIASFSGPTILHHDLFVEVKSFEESKRFYWTRNEMETAERYGEKYALYLIERRRMNEPNYQPEIIRGPYAALILSQTSGWSVSPTTYECVAP